MMVARLPKDVVVLHSGNAGLLGYRAKATQPNKHGFHGGSCLQPMPHTAHHQCSII